ncbi:MAG: DUF6048 family protein [Bacteroidales bacterium]|jgi:hypothetical protein|nr:DUF6048 family protein [Bacteroidales bacterium]
MEKTSVYIISILIFLFSLPAMAQNEPPDSVDILLKLKVGIEVAGPAIYFTDKNNLSIEGYFSADLNERRALYFSGGYSDFKYSQYNYSYISKGFYVKAGVDFNLLKPATGMGKYWAGIGLHYGLSSFISETPFLKYENYWGTTSSSIARKTDWGHYLEASPGFRAEIFRNFNIGWSISLRKLIYTGTGKDLKPIFIPGYGSANKSFSTGISYYLMWSIPYKKIRVTVKEEPPSETGEQEEP